MGHGDENQTSSLDSIFQRHALCATRHAFALKSEL
jgi:hypothetical protein